MRNITGPPVVDEDLYGREYELTRLWEKLEQGEHVLMLAPRRVGKTSLMLELRRAPRRKWDVVYVDVEGAAGAADCVAAIVAAPAADPRYRNRFEAIPFSNAVKDVLARLQSVSVDVLRVELKDAIGREWEHAADQLLARLTSLPDTGGNLLIIIDELPLLVSRLLRAGERRHEAEMLLSRLRHWRQAPALRDRIRTLIGGSIGLEGILRRVGLSGLINDLAPFHVTSWNRTVAVEFLRGLGSHCDFHLSETFIARMMDLLQDPVPYHVQLFFSALRDACRGEASRVSREIIERCFEERLAGAGGTAHLDHYAERLEIAFDEQEHDLAHDILSRACRRKGGVRLTALGDMRGQSEPAVQSVLRDLEVDGYLRRAGSRVEFRSNLLRVWWRKHHARSITPWFAGGSTTQPN
ncbi:MAG: ATP-binding protein [Acidobacteria bacterium]|nr:ATP-binding protein [Acidobacteriota bacterium]